MHIALFILTVVFNHSYIWLMRLTIHFVNIPEHLIKVYIRTVNHANFEKPKLSIINDIPASMTTVHYQITITFYN